MSMKLLVYLLLESFTLPMLTYGLNVLFLPQYQMSKLNACWNSIYRRIFSFCRWESVREVQVLCERLDLIHLIDKSKLDFLVNCVSDNCVVTCCVKLIKQCNDFFHLYSRYDACMEDRVSYQTIYSKFYQIFAELVDVLYVDVFVQDLFSLVCISVVTSVYRCPFICTICFCLRGE